MLNFIYIESINKTYSKIEAITLSNNMINIYKEYIYLLNHL